MIRFLGNPGWLLPHSTGSSFLVLPHSIDSTSSSFFPTSRYGGQVGTMDKQEGTADGEEDTVDKKEGTMDRKESIMW